jgi:predicted transcriptional regulator
MGFDLSSQKNPAASVHAVLTRLAEKGQIKKITDDNGEVTWRGPNFDEDYAQQMEISDDDIPF